MIYMSNGFFSVFKKHNKNNVFFKTMKTSMVFTVIPVIIAGICLLTYNNRIVNEKIEMYHNDAHTRIEKVWDNISYSITNINSITSIGRLLTSITNPEFYQDSYDLSQDLNSLTKILNNSIYPTQYITSMYLYNERTDYIVSTSGCGTRDMFWDTAWYDSLDDYKNSVSCYYRSMEVGFQNYEYITIIHPISSAQGCYAIYNIDYKLLKADLQNTASTISEVYITDTQGTVIFSYNKEDINKKIEEFDKLKEMPEKYVLKSGTYSFNLYSVRGKNADFPTKNYGYFLFALVCVLVISCISSSIYTSNTFSKSIAKVIMAIPDDDFENKSDSDEFTFIIDRISNLLVQNSKFENEFAVQLSKLKTAQIQALQEQINPHFIFNTLNLISLIDLSEDKENHHISQIVSLMSDILRFIINTDEYIVSIETEINYLKKYVELQCIKYEDKFRVEWDIDADTLGLCVVNFSLQPLVENAIMHGFVNKNTDNLIKIRTHAYDGILTLEIYNNGQPIPKDKLDELNNKLQNGTPSSNGRIGLLNVNLRYKLIFGDEYKCRITSDSSNGTKITLTFPAIDKADFKPYEEKDKYIH